MLREMSFPALGETGKVVKKEKKTLHITYVTSLSKYPPKKNKVYCFLRTRSRVIPWVRGQSCFTCVEVVFPRRGFVFSFVVLTREGYWPVVIRTNHEKSRLSHWRVMQANASQQPAAAFARLRGSCWYSGTPAIGYPSVVQSSIPTWIRNCSSANVLLTCNFQKQHFPAWGSFNKDAAAQSCQWAIEEDSRCCPPNIVCIVLLVHIYSLRYLNCKEKTVRKISFGCTVSCTLPHIRG